MLGVAWLRIASAAVVFALWRRPWRGFLRLDRDGRLLIVGLGAVFAVMNACFYLAIDRMPLGTVAAIEFLGPVVLALAGARTARNVLAVGLAAGGVYLLTRVRLEGQPLGVLFAFLNAALFSFYIVLAHRVSRRGTMGGIDGLGAAMLVAVLCVTPIGGGVSSSVIPYVFDQLALARLARATYALLVALLPATATAIGVVVLRQIPSAVDVFGVALVMAAVALHREPDLTEAPLPALQQ